MNRTPNDLKILPGPLLVKPAEFLSEAALAFGRRPESTAISSIPQTVSDRYPLWPSTAISAALSAPR